jgi:outer membrane protein OmpA-like peptidoglycan-associated protein
VKLHLIAAGLLMSVGLAANVHADETRTEGLNLELTPYFWAAGVDGKISGQNQSVNFDRSFSDIISNVDAAFMGLAVVSYDRFVLYADYDYINLSDDAKTKNGVIVPVGTKVKGELDLRVGTYGGGYRFDTFGKNTVDVLVGAQITDLEPKIKILGQNFSNKSNLTDTVVMLRPSFQISERWRFNPTFAYGVSGDSDTTYTMMPQVQYQFSDSFAARFGYKKLHYEYDDNGPNSDVDISGVFIGVGWTFPARPERVAAAPPPPPVAKKPVPVIAAAPAKCPDADKDGVCDAADQCPNTLAGTRVGPAGCDCDFVLRTHFAFDSAELTAEDRAQLDQLVPQLLNPKLGFVTGEIDGHTDNVGNAAHNLALSKRRADAVANYLKAQGVKFGDRFATQGFGDTKPVASNNTAEGRAQNRRASIRRSDCGPAQ